MLVPLTGSAAIMTKAAPSVFDDLPSQIEVVEPAEESQMLDASGAVIARFYDKQRIVVPSEAIAEPMKQAIVAIEDKRFYEHNGVDATGIARALVSNLADTGMQGASTITQQYVRNALQEKGYLEGDAEQVTAATEQTTARKLREIKYALALERKMDKDQILTGYLNIAPFGPITYGVEAASQRYFSKSASELSALEAALLAGLVQSPVEYDPLTYPEAAQQRRDIVLDVMLQQELITQEEHDAGIATPVADMLHPAANSEGCTGVKNSAGYFCDFALAQYLSDETYGETEAERLHLLKTGGLTIRTTLDPAKQQAAFDALTAAIPVGDPSGVNDALASVVPQTGAIVALAQNTTYGVEEGQTMSSFAANGRFQAGSTFKVFTLTQWFKEGHGAYETVGSNNRSYGPNAFKCAGQPITTEPWTVNDLPGKDGPMTALRAVGLSGNQAFISMASKVDFGQIFQTAADLGVTDVDGEPVTPLPANVLGTSPTSPLDMRSPSPPSPTGASSASPWRSPRSPIAMRTPCASTVRTARPRSTRASRTRSRRLSDCRPASTTRECASRTASPTAPSPAPPTTMRTPGSPASHRPCRPRPGWGTPNPPRRRCRTPSSTASSTTSSTASPSAAPRSGRPTCPPRSQAPRSNPSRSVISALPDRRRAPRRTGTRIRIRTRGVRSRTAHLRTARRTEARR